MFTYSSSDTVIPSLTFTKAELVYFLAVLSTDIPPTDNTKRLELVEVRHYLNQIKDKVALAASDGTLRRAMRLPDEEGHKDIPPKPKAAPRPSLPSMSELRRQFPTLSEGEIRETLARAKEEREREEREREEKDKLSASPPPPSFMAKEQPTTSARASLPTKPLSPKEEKDRENAIKFASMLGQL